MTTNDIYNHFTHHQKFHDIEFVAEPHQYVYHGGNEPEVWQGITSLIKQFAPFDRKGVAYAIAKRDGISQSEVLQQWEEKANKGDQAHNRIEKGVTTGAYDPESEAADIMDFFQDNDFHPIVSEYPVYCPILKRATKIDQLCVNNRNEIVVFDYKTSREIRYKPYMNRNKPRMMEYPLSRIYNNNFYSYSLQISIERLWLEKYYLGKNIKLAPNHYILHITDNNIVPHIALDMYSQVDIIYEWVTK